MVICMKQSLNKKVTITVIVGMSVIVIFSIIVSYLFYSNALNNRLYLDSEEYKKQFFVIFTLAELIVTILISFIIMSILNSFIVKPIKSLNDALSIDIKDDEDYGENNKAAQKNISEMIKKSNINSGDEIEQLYQNILRMQMNINDYIGQVKDDKWEVEHDNMTMLSNSKKFEKRSIEVYPYADTIYVACLDIINMSVVNTKLSVEAGDSIIGKVGRELRRISSETIHTYRLHDDIFLVVMIGYKEDEAVNILTHWNERVGRLNRITDSFECKIVWGGSFGENNFNVMEVFKRADAEMYCNKMIAKNELATV